MTAAEKISPFASAIAFLRSFHRDAPWHLVAIHLESKDVKACSFEGRNREARAHEWVMRWNIAHGYEIYFHPNPLNRRNHKARKQDVAAAAWLWVDIDPPTKDIIGDELLEWRRTASAQSPPGIPPPTLTIDSGRGYWFFWRLKEPIALDGDAAKNIEMIESCGRTLERAFAGADNCHSIDHVVRLPGTINHKTGARAMVIEARHGVAYELSDFPAPEPRQEARREAKAEPSGGKPKRGAPPIETMDAALRWLAERDVFRDYSGVRKDGDKIVGIGWIEAGMALKTAYLDDGEELWAITHNSDEARAAAQAKWESFSAEPRSPQVTIATLIRAAKDAGFAFPVIEAGVARSDFHAYLPMHKYIYAPTREMWPAESVNGKLPRVAITGEDGKAKEIKPAAWLDQNQSVEQMTWAPGAPMLIRDRLVSDGGWIEHEGVTTFNLYRPPVIGRGDPQDVAPWLDHLRKIYPDEAEHIIKWLAFKVQNPGVKINHALVLGGSQGIGKDTLVEPVKHAVGPWNFSELAPREMLGRFNGFVKSVILRVNEARDLGDADRFEFYDHMKSLIAAPPDVLRCDEKHLREHAVFNVCGVILTTNHKTTGIYLPPDDRRHFVAWSHFEKEAFEESYWLRLWSWYENGGFENVAAYLATYDLAGFDPKAPPPKTPAFWEIVDSNRAPEEAELADVIDAMMNPPAFSTAKLLTKAQAFPIHAWLIERKNHRAYPHKLGTCGYSPVRNPDVTHGLWTIGGKRQAIYAKTNMSVRDRIEAAREIVEATSGRRRGQDWTRDE